jgi:hypothetical protein
MEEPDRPVTDHAQTQTASDGSSRRRGVKE